MVMLLIISSVLFQLSCGGESNENENAAVQDITGTSDRLSEPEAEVIVGEPEIREDLPDEDYGGYDFTVLVFDNQIWSWSEIIAEEETGDAINDAFYRRNRLIEDRFNINIKQVTTRVDNVPVMLRLAPR